MRSWKTSLAGFFTLAFAIVPTIWPEHSALCAKIVAGATAAGLLAARDNDKSSEDVGADK